MKDKVFFAMRLFLVFIFLSAGLCKLAPALSEGYSRGLEVSFRESFTPLWQKTLFDKLGVKLDSQLHMQIVGGTEVVCALLLFTSLRKLAGLVLFLLMLAATYTHLEINEPAVFPATLACVSGVCGLVGGSAKGPKVAEKIQAKAKKAE